MLTVSRDFNVCILPKEFSIFLLKISYVRGLIEFNKEVDVGLSVLVELSTHSYIFYWFFYVFLYIILDYFF